MMMNLIHDTRHLYTHFGIDGMKAMLPSISEGKQAITFANTSNCSRVCLFYQNKTNELIVMQKLQIKFEQKICYILFAVTTSTVATASKAVTMILFTHNYRL